jgi:hypothetical protein
MDRWVGVVGVRFSRDMRRALGQQRPRDVRAWRREINRQNREARQNRYWAALVADDEPGRLDARDTWHPRDPIGALRARAHRERLQAAHEAWRAAGGYNVETRAEEGVLEMLGVPDGSPFVALHVAQPWNRRETRQWFRDQMAQVDGREQPNDPVNDDDDMWSWSSGENEQGEVIYHPRIPTNFGALPQPDDEEDEDEYMDER